VDDEAALRRIVEALHEIGRALPIVFPVHPRTIKMMESFGLHQAGAGGVAGEGLRIVEPLGYLDFLHLEKRAALVLTDSGGVQEEASILGVPCLTLRENTERPVTVSRGTNRLVGSDRDRIVREARRILKPGRKPGRRKAARIPLWDGRAASRIARVFAGLAR
jgi:UDP-N-acetylglucosamine 2-epimerase (non-hydrolysing)